MALIPAAITTDRMLSVLLLSASLFFLEMLTGPWWAVPSDISRQHAGTVAGTMNTASNVAGTVSPMAFGLLTQGGNWTAPFVISAVILVVGAVAWVFLVHPEVPLAATGASRPASARA